MIQSLYPESDRGPITWAEADENLSYSTRLRQTVDRLTSTAAAVGRAIHPFTPVGIGAAIGTDLAEHPGEFPRLFSTAERQTRLVETSFSQDQAREEAYDRRIKAVKDATGITLENPERGGYALTERELRRLSQDGPINPTDHRRSAFDRELEKARLDNPDKTEALTFGNIDDEARAIAKGAESEYEAARHDTKLSGASSIAMQFAGGLWGMRRDPLFVGSMFAGPTGAVGRSVAARIASSGLIQGFYNAGLTAIEQPAVQAWRSELGLKSGMQPALEHTGLAFLFGLIPGAALRGVHEIAAANRAPVQRVLAGVPEAGDIEKAVAAAGPEIAPEQAAAVKLANEIDAADQVTAPVKPPEVSPELHEDLTAAALRKADDPVGSPSPEAVAAVTPKALPKLPAPPDPLELARAGTLSSTRAKKIGASVKADQEAVENQIFGSKELADKWRKLNRQSDRAWDAANDAKAKEYDRQIEELETRTGLSQQDQDFLDGKGWPDHTNADNWAKLARDLRDVEGDRADAVATVGYALRRLPQPGKPLADFERENLALIQHAINEEVKRGGEPDKFLEEAFRKSGERYGGGPDAKEIIASDMARLRELMQNAPEPPVALPAPAAPEPEAVVTKHVGPKKPRGRAAADPQTWSLLEFLASKGGLKSDDPLIADVLAAFGGKNKFVPGFGNLVRKTGMPLDRAREAAVEAGYIIDQGNISGGEAQTTVVTLIDHIHEEARGNKVYRQGYEPPIDPRVAERNRAALEAHFDEGLQDIGVPPGSYSDSIRQRALQMMEKEGERDPVQAFERAEMEDAQGAIEKGELVRPPDEHPIAGWDVPDDTGAAPPAGRGVAGERPGAGEAARGPSERDRTPAEGEIAARIAEAAPKTEREAQMAASEAIEDIGNREDMTRTRAALEADKLPPVEPPPEGAPKPAPLAKNDPLDKIPLVRDDGTPTIVTAKTAARAGERETKLSDIIKECK